MARGAPRSSAPAGTPVLRCRSHREGVDQHSPRAGANRGVARGTFLAMSDLERVPEDWERGLAVVADPDDMEYGAAAAIARWTRQGKWIGYVLVTDGKAGIAPMPPEQAAPIRREEQIASCREVGVTDIEFLGLPDGGLIEGLELRAELAGAIRRHRPDVVVSINHRASGAGRAPHADHRAVGRALLDAVRVPPTLGSSAISSGDVWNGVRFTAFNASPSPTHGVDTTATFDAGVRSLVCHRTYLENLGGDTVSPDKRLRGAAESSGQLLGVDLAATFELIG